MQGRACPDFAVIFLEIEGADLDAASNVQSRFSPMDRKEQVER